MKSAIRTLELFEAFASARRPLNITELSALLRMPVSSCFGLVSTLATQGYLQPAGDKKAFYPTRKMLRCAEVIAAHEPIVNRLIPRLRRLRDESRETVILGKPQAHWRSVVYLEVLESPQSIRYSAAVGDVKPLHSSSIGKAVLSSLQPARLEALLQKIQLERVTRNTITSKSRLRSEIQAGIRRGYQMTAGENLADVSAIAAPLLIDGQVYGVGIAAPLARMERQLGRLTGLLGGAMSSMKTGEDR